MLLWIINIKKNYQNRVLIKLVGFFLFVLFLSARRYDPQQHEETIIICPEECFPKDLKKTLPSSAIIHWLCRRTLTADCGNANRWRGNRLRQTVVPSVSDGCEQVALAKIDALARKTRPPSPFGLKRSASSRPRMNFDRSHGGNWRVKKKNKKKKTRVFIIIIIVVLEKISDREKTTVAFYERGIGNIKKGTNNKATRITSPPRATSMRWGQCYVNVSHGPGRGVVDISFLRRVRVRRLRWPYVHRIRSVARARVREMTLKLVTAAAPPCTHLHAHRIPGTFGQTIIDSY